LRKIRILLVSSPALSEVIRYLFRAQPRFEVVGSLRNLKHFAELAGRLLPELIVVNVKPVRTGVCPVLVAIKQSSPSSKIILICAVSTSISDARKCGADACLDQEQIVRRLVPTASAVSAHLPRRAAIPQRLISLPVPR
jgi:chemotaxis response regulator CheB